MCRDIFRVQANALDSSSTDGDTFDPDALIVGGALGNEHRVPELVYEEIRAGCYHGRTGGYSNLPDA